MPKHTVIVTTADGDHEVDLEVPTASVPADTWSQGFHEALKTQEPYAGMVYGAAKGVLPGAAKGAWDVVKFLPYTLPKALFEAGSALYTDPVGTLTKAKDTLVNAPKEVSDAYERAINFAATDPEAFGEQVGEQVGALAGGAAAGKFTPVRSGVRLTGKALQAAGEHPFAARMSGGAMLGRGVLNGNVPTAAAGIATMALPKFLTTAGKALRELSGEDLSGTLPSGARSIDVGDVSKLKTSGIRVGGPPSSGPPVPTGLGDAGPSVPAALNPNSGARTIDVGDIADLPTVAHQGSDGVRIAYPGNPTGPAPYRAAAKAAAQEDGPIAGAAIPGAPEPPLVVGGRVVDPSSTLYKAVKQQQGASGGAGSVRVGGPPPVAAASSVTTPPVAPDLPDDVPVVAPVPPGGATDADIIALRTEHGAEEAGTKLAKDPRFAGLSKTERTNAIRDIAGDEAGLAPTSMQRDIDAKLTKMGPKEAAAYLAKAPNAVAYKYISSQMKRLGLLVGEE